MWTSWLIPSLKLTVAGHGALTDWQLTVLWDVASWLF